MKIIIYKIKTGKKDQWQQWCRKLVTEYYTQALATLKEEGVLLETFHTMSIGGDDYAIGVEYAPHKKISINVSAFQNLNNVHRQQKQECLEFVGQASQDYLLSFM